MFSILVAVRGPAPWLIDALQSVARQSFQDWEMVCVLDGFSATIQESVQGVVPEARIFTLPQNSGVAAARNEALRQASGQLIAVIDADDIWHQGHLSAHAIAFNANPHLVLRGTGAALIDSRGLELGTSIPIPSRFLRHNLLIRNVFVHSSVAYRRAEALSVGGYGAGLQVGEDYALWMRLAQRGLLLNDTEDSILYRVHGNQTSQTGLYPNPFESLSSDRDDLLQHLGVPALALGPLRWMFRLRRHIHRRTRGYLVEDD